MKTLLLLLFLIILPTLGQAHSWYPVECCSGQDCRPVDCDTLSENNDGSVTYQDKDLKITYPKDRVKPSQDSKCHVCYGNYAHTPYCVFIQQGS